MSRDFTDWNSFLAHHGIKGQQWGVRRGPPYPIDDKVLKKGTKLNSVNWYKNDADRPKGRWTYTYRPDEEWDAKVYKGPFSYYKTRGQIPMWEHKYETTKDLKMPTKQERMDAFVDLYMSKDISAKELKSMQKLLNRNNYEYVYGNGKVNVKKLKTKEDFEEAYEIFNHMMEAVQMYKSTKAYAKLMSTKYDAMVDDNNQWKYNEARDPIIVFVNDSLKEVGDASIVALNDMIKNYWDVHAELDPKGKKVRL